MLGRGNSFSIYGAEETQYVHIEDQNQANISNPAQQI